MIPFNKPYVPITTEKYLKKCIDSLIFEDGYFIKQCSETLKSSTTASHVFLTPSCTAALEMIALLLELQPGDEVIMPSYTFVSTANAFVLRGVTPVFIDIRPDTLNIDETLIESAITEKTKAIIVVHYAGVACEMHAINDIAHKHGLYVIEDAAQGLAAKYYDKSLGSLSDMAVLSFHHTKNVTAGLGGALLINNEKFIEKAKIIWQKGTNRSAFINKLVDKYTWVDLGSSYMMCELNAALLYAQLEMLDVITSMRLAIWETYHAALKKISVDRHFQVPNIPQHCQHNAHIYYLIMQSQQIRDDFINNMREQGVATSFHYIPLHSAPAGKKFTRVHGALYHTDDLASRLVRLPLYVGLADDEVEHIVKAVNC